MKILILTFAFISNVVRRKSAKKFNLVPNCLLTRWPLLFISGPRSIFYFNSYWNIYPLFLAEHGYEVFNLNLPWNSRAARKKSFQSFLEQQSAKNKSFHLMLDYPTFKEFEKIIQEYCQTTILSFSILTADKTIAPNYGRQIHSCAENVIRFLEKDNDGSLTYKLHLRYLSFLNHKDLPSFATLGGSSTNCVENSLTLLQRARELAEQDYFRG